MPTPSPETILILRSLEAINETLKGLAQRGSATSEVEVDAPPLREEVPVVEVSAVPRNPHQDIKRELQKIRLPEFSGGRSGIRAESWLEEMTRCLTLQEYTSTSKSKLAIFQLKGAALNWWGNQERQLHLTPDTVPWELFVEKFKGKYLPASYQEEQAGALHALVQRHLSVEEYEERFMELVKYVPYLDNDERQVERFVYGLNAKIRAQVRMWKPSSVAEAVDCARYTEEMLGAKPIRSFNSQQSWFAGKTPRSYL